MCKNIFVVLFASLITVNLAVAPSEFLDCSKDLQCDFEPPLTWATDGMHCKVFYNKCHLRNYNCKRNEGVLVQVAEEKCPLDCPVECTSELKPLCTEYRGNFVTFNNPCLWGKAICRNGEAYIYASEESCLVSQG